MHICIAACLVLLHVAEAAGLVVCSHYARVCLACNVVHCDEAAQNCRADPYQPGTVCGLHIFGFLEARAMQRSHIDPQTPRCMLASAFTFGSHTYS